MAPRFALLETITMSLAFSCSQTALTAAQAPPLPMIKTFLPSICTLCALTIYKNPPKSVLNPFNLPSTLTIVLTAPMALALSSISSKYGMTSFLYGIVTLIPLKSFFSINSLNSSLFNSTNW